MESTVAMNPPAEIFSWAQTDLYRFFAFAFGTPSRERHEWFSQPGAAEALGQLWRQLSKRKFPGFHWFHEYASYESAYLAVFEVGAPEAPVPLFESAHHKTRPAQELVLENTFFYDVFGLRVDPAVSVPDHLVTQLEFLSAVAYAHDQAKDEPRQAELSRLERDFLERHLLDWTGKANRRMRHCPFSPFKVLFNLMVLQLRRHPLL